jgi:hypothetical protein
MKIKKKLKLFVWIGFCPDYTSGLAFALASSEAKARALVEKEYGIGHGYPREWGTLAVYPVGKQIAFCVSGGAFPGASRLGC